jgi:Na+-driven multidrug efflux pump
MLQYWAVRVPVAVGGAFLLGLEEPVVAVFWGVTLSNVAAALWLAGYYHYSTTNGMNRRAAEEAAGAPGG